MLKESELSILQNLINSSSQEQLMWIHGYLSGVVYRNGTSAVADSKNQINIKLTVAYGTDTGNSKSIAINLTAKLKNSGIKVKTVNLEQYRLTDLAKEEYLIIILSTHGEGEPPSGAKKFYDHIHNNSIDLTKLKYCVLSLGDSAYPLFCQAGVDVDLKLAQLGAVRILPIVKADVDYTALAENWSAQLLDKLGSTRPAAGTTLPTPVSGGRNNYQGQILTNINLNDIGSNKSTYHLEIAANGVVYQPGDALGIIPLNSENSVKDALAAIKANGEETFTFRDQNYNVAELLRRKLNIEYLSSRVITKYAELIKQEIDFASGSMIELLTKYPLPSQLGYDQVLAILEPITPRLYSISSSPNAHSDEIHLTVALDTFSLNGETKYGLASHYLATLPVESSMEFYIQSNGQFKLPEAKQDIIMIGAGTGIAPFRSFIAERDATSCSGRNWLFFGEQYFKTDFLYQTELQDWLANGTLTKISLAFSRNQKQKIYVQHKIRQQGQELFDWINGGASIYVCGSKDKMSKDVEKALVDVIGQYGNLTTEAAHNYLAELSETGRYLKDVY